MPIEPAAGGTSLIDVLDRVLDKGIVIDAGVRVSLVGSDLILVGAPLMIEAPFVVASIETYLKHFEPVSRVSPGSRAVPPERWRSGDDDDDGGGGSSGAPAKLFELKSRPRR